MNNGAFELKKKTTIITILLSLVAVTVLGFTVVNVIKNRANSIEVQTGTEESQTETTTKFDYDNLSQILTSSEKIEISAEMLEKANLSEESLKTLETEGQGGEITSSRFHEITGYTLNAFTDKFGSEKSKDMGNNGKDSFVLAFTGDINFDETSYYVMCHALEKENKVLDCIDSNFQNVMKSADIMLVNNEFTYSLRGTPTEGKKYTFRANPEYVHYLTDMGVDIVSLANNHTFDYGYDSFTDTLSTLENAGIEYVGAGMNSDEANAVKSFIINGYKVGYIACSGVEYPIHTPVATEDSAGIMGSYDNGEAVTKAVKSAKKECDYVIVYPHWGYENTTELSSAQTSNAKQWIDAGADAIIGNHSHCLQGMDFYKGKFIAYSLGNFWFNSKTLPTGILQLTISEEGIEPGIVPGIQENRETRMYTSLEDQRKVYDLIESYPAETGVKIDDNGKITDAGATVN